MSTHTHEPRPVVEQAFDVAGEAPTCDDCRGLHADAIAARLALLPEGLPGDGVWEGIQTRIAADAARSQLRVVLGCTYCKDALQRADAVYCATCLAPHHDDCFQEHGRCSTPGCGDTDVVRSTASTPPTEHKGWRSRHPRGERPLVKILVWALILLSLAGIVEQVYRFVAPPQPDVRATEDLLAREAALLDEEAAVIGRLQEKVDRLLDETGVDGAPSDVPFVSGSPTAANVMVHDGDVRAVLIQLAALGETNVILEPEVTGTVTTDLKGVHWLTAFSQIVSSLGDFVVSEDGDGLLRVVPASSIEQQLVTGVFDLAALSADDADALVASLRVLAGEGHVDGVLVSHLRDRQTLVVYSTKPALQLLRRVLDDTLGEGDDAPDLDLPTAGTLQPLAVSDLPVNEVRGLLQRLELETYTTFTPEGVVVVFGSPEQLEAVQRGLDALRAAEPR